MTADEIKEACRLAREYADADPPATTLVARALLAVVAQRDVLADAAAAEQRGYQRALDEVADYVTQESIDSGWALGCTWAKTIRAGRAKPNGGDRG